MKRVFLTGASSGIGLAIAKMLSNRGDEVWGTSREPTRIPQSAHIHPVRLDLLDPNSIEQAFNSAISEAGYFDVVINNAGSGHFGAAEHLSDAEIEKQFQILVFGHLQLMRRAIPAMRARGQGLIINVTSLASRLPVPFMAAYNAAKAAIAAYTMSIQLELPDSNVRIVDLQPADILTSFNDAVPKREEHDPRYKERVAKTWSAVDRNMKKAPPPDLVAKRALELIDSLNPPPRITVGDAFQSKVAPFIFRFLPQRVRVWGLKMYYGI
ncbi:MAG TPA: SDR family NAD(P)-dependent oxidoreductase [Chthoniobacterales bacterium]|jgi:NAD(P)-dependent dehydrogenase (short-subunit alcohol dehydrogenase family)|nr:SDR family NAD(P)-dependent oxidoreductase [Chthoniobacterales bacterium]